MPTTLQLAPTNIETFLQPWHIQSVQTRMGFSKVYIFELYSAPDNTEIVSEAHEIGLTSRGAHCANGDRVAPSLPSHSTALKVIQFLLIYP